MRTHAHDRHDLELVQQVKLLRPHTSRRAPINESTQPLPAIRQIVQEVVASQKIESMKPNHWPVLLIVLAILIGVGICLRQFEFLLVNEVKALVSIFFGFAISCLL